MQNKKDLINSNTLYIDLRAGLFDSGSRQKFIRNMADIFPGTHKARPKIIHAMVNPGKSLGAGGWDIFFAKRIASILNAR